LAEFGGSDKWDHKTSSQSEPVMHQRSSSEYSCNTCEQYVFLSIDTTQHHYTQLQHANVNISVSVDQQDDTAMDNVIISCTVGDEEALVDKACSCTGSRRRLVRQKRLMITRQRKGNGRSTRQSKKNSGLGK